MEDVIDAKDKKIIILDDRLHGGSLRHLFDETIEPEFYKSDISCKEWTSRREYAKDYPEVRKKYSFRSSLFSKK